MGIYGIGLSSLITNILVYIAQHRCLLTLEKAKVTTEVPFFDTNNLNGIGVYLSLAIPALFSELLEWIAYDILSIMAGTLDIYTFGCYIIYDNVLKLWCTLPIGLTYSTITLVGNKIGEVKV